MPHAYAKFTHPLFLFFLIISPSDFVTALVAQSSQKSSNKASYQNRTSQVFPGFQVKQGIFKSNNIIVSVSFSQLLTGLKWNDPFLPVPVIIFFYLITHQDAALGVSSENSTKGAG